MTPKRPLIESERTLFLKNRHNLTRCILIALYLSYKSRHLETQVQIQSDIMKTQLGMGDLLLNYILRDLTSAGHITINTVLSHLPSFKTKKEMNCTTSLFLSNVQVQCPCTCLSVDDITFIIKVVFFPNTIKLFLIITKNQISKNKTLSFV